MSELWNIERIQSWYQTHDWIIGSNFIPSNAINQLEMWQEDTFDSAVIDRELGYASKIGFNTMRVYLHDFLWLDSSSLFLKRVEEYLRCASTNSIKTIFVFFDACWNNHPCRGTQPAPLPGKHNSGWVQSPSTKILGEKTEWRYLKQYVQGVMEHFKSDERVLCWDLYNEPGNEALLGTSFELLESVFTWAREVDVVQPVTTALWNWQEQFRDINRFIASNSDLSTFHYYGPPHQLEEKITDLQKLGRPIVCTEYLARTMNSLFQNTLPVLKKHKIGAINWGLVNGKTQTHIPWSYYPKITEELSPKKIDVWFHDILHQDGTPYRQEEISFIKKIISEK